VCEREYDEQRGSSGPIDIRREVKQDCPLSPLLFNSCINPFLRRLNMENLNDIRALATVGNEIDGEDQTNYKIDDVLIC
jgi:hypothetical protein